MDNTKIVKCDNLINCITNTLNVDMPLYINNKNSALKFDFEDVDDVTTENIIRSIMNYLLIDNSFWVCEYGSDSVDILVNKNFFLNTVPDISVLPYHSKSIDSDWFEYEHNSIVCAHTTMDNFNVNAYIKYVTSKDFISNTIFLIDDIRNIALHVYDRRGMDIAATDEGIVKQLFERYKAYVSKYYLQEILKITSRKNDFI